MRPPVCVYVCVCARARERLSVYVRACVCVRFTNLNCWQMFKLSWRHNKRLVSQRTLWEWDLRARVSTRSWSAVYACLSVCVFVCVRASVWLCTHVCVATQVGQFYYYYKYEYTTRHDVVTRISWTREAPFKWSVLVWTFTPNRSF